jgi:4-hydroxy-tetrahydrodipicolinate reductase
VFGEHEIVFAANDEVVRLSHSALSRSCFARGALLAAGWVSGRSDGRVHDFSEVVAHG